MSPEMNRTPNQIDISPEALAHLGDGRIAYVKTIRSEDVRAIELLLGSSGRGAGADERRGT